MDDFWGRLSSLISERGFVPTELLVDSPTSRVNKRQPTKDPITLFEAVRLAYGFEWKDIEASDVTYWNWRQIRAEMKEIWAALDQASSDFAGRPTKAIPWSYKATCTKDDAIKLVTSAAHISPLSTTSTPLRRPESRLMVNPGKMDAAIVNTCAVVRRNSNLEYSDILCVNLNQDLTDEEFLGLLDERVSVHSYDRQLEDNRDLIPRQLVRAKMAVQASSEEVRTFLDFLRALELSNNISGLSDQALLGRLLRISPESSKQALGALGDLTKA